VINAILIALLYGVGIPDTIYDTALSVPGCPSCSLGVGRALEHLQERGKIVVVHVPLTDDKDVWCDRARILSKKEQ